MTTQIVPSQSQNRFGRVAAFAYGITAYFIFLATFLYACGFVGNVIVPRSIDSAPIVPLGHALMVNIALLGLFALQHSGMARKEFKQKWTKIVPKAVERSTYVLFTSLCLITLFYFWQPMGGSLWQINSPIGTVALHSLSAIGWLIVLGTTFLINHFELFGLQQVWFYLRGKNSAPAKFVTPGLYKYVRHPLYVGFLIAFWATPCMTVAHLVFSLMVTLYVLSAIQLEERDLIADHGENYKSYRRRVPMLIPFTRSRRSAS
ncbi:MAG: methanethiol S-methyltransferase [Cyanobacteria bacterium P01_F01_bin.53]